MVGEKKRPPYFEDVGKCGSGTIYSIYSVPKLREVLYMIDAGTKSIRRCNIRNTGQ